MMKIEEVFNKFVSSLRDRKGFLSEDNIRFYWFASMLQQDHELNHYSLEEPYGNQNENHKELDLMYDNNNERWCMEIKFHKHPINEVGSSKKTFAHTMSAGEIFDDLRRLPFWRKGSLDDKPTRFLFLYVTDGEMNDYLSGNKNSNSFYRQTLSTFYKEEKNKAFTCVFNCGTDESTPKTFFKHSLENYDEDTKVHLTIQDIKMIYSSDIISHSHSLKHDKKEKEGMSETCNCHIRLYELITIK